MNTVLLLTENQTKLELPYPPSLPPGSAFLSLSIGNVLFLLYIGKSVYVMNVKTAGNLNTVFIFVYRIYKKRQKLPLLMHAKLFPRSSRSVRWGKNKGRFLLAVYERCVRGGCSVTGPGHPGALGGAGAPGRERGTAS